MPKRAVVTKRMQLLLTDGLVRQVQDYYDERHAAELDRGPPSLQQVLRRLIIGGLERHHARVRKK